MSDNYLEAKAVLNDVKSSTKRFVKFRVKDGDVDNSYAHCTLLAPPCRRRLSLSGESVTEDNQEL